MNPRKPIPPRLVDLHVDWSLQYAGESTLFHPDSYADIPVRLPQVDGYLGATRAAVLACYRDAEDWAHQPDPWQALIAQITALESEFSGRILMGPDDLAFWQSEPDQLCWGVLGVEGFDALIRTRADLDRLAPLFHRGVRVFQPTYLATSLLAGSSQSKDDRGLLDLGRDFLATLLSLAPPANEPGPRPILDLAHLNPLSCSQVLDWYESDPTHAERLPVVYSHGTIAHPAFDHPRALSQPNLVRLRALGGTIGLSVTPPFTTSPDHLKSLIETAAAIPFKGEPGLGGIAIGTDFLGVGTTHPTLSNAEQITNWLAESFNPADAKALAAENALELIGRACGGSHPQG
ncbi:membrane dipeptidase [Isosphaeraceae bacterium EP7]